VRCPAESGRGGSTIVDIGNLRMSDVSPKVRTTSDCQDRLSASHPVPGQGR
jgi:hypothetical protein